MSAGILPVLPTAFLAIHTIADLSASSGGPSRTVPALCESIRLDGRWTPRLLTGAAGPATSAVRVPLEVTAADALVQAIESTARSARHAIVHDHGVWLRRNLLAARAAKHAGVPLIVSPRGMLEPWALSHRAWKKRLAWWTYQRQLLDAAALLHATSYAEAVQLRKLGLHSPIAIIPNGVVVPVVLPPRPAGAIREALFLSRLHPKKGILMLLEAWHIVAPVGWRLRLVGPDEDGHKAQVAQRIAELSLGAQVTIEDEVADDDKWALYRAADLFVLPSYSENFGVVVAEALACGVPVITTTGTPWQDLPDQGCGWWTPAEPAALAHALREATMLHRPDLQARGDRGRHWVAASFSWSAIGVAMANVYDWVVAGALADAAPACVLLEQPRRGPSK